MVKRIGALAAADVFGVDRCAVSVGAGCQSVAKRSNKPGRAAQHCRIVRLCADLPLKERLTKLAGLRIGGPDPPNAQLFASVGLDADRDIEMLVFRGPEQNKEFADSRVDALYAHTPYLETVLVDQDAVMIVNQSVARSPQLAARQIHALVVSRRLVSEQPQTVTALVPARIARAQTLVIEIVAARSLRYREEFPDMNRRHVETIVSIYEPAIPADPRVAAEGFEPALRLFPASRKAPDLAGIKLTEFVAPQFATDALCSLATQPAGKSIPQVIPFL